MFYFYRHVIGFICVWLRIPASFMYFPMKMTPWICQKLASLSVSTTFNNYAFIFLWVNSSIIQNNNILCCRMSKLFYASCINIFRNKESLKKKKLLPVCSFSTYFLLITCTLDEQTKASLNKVRIHITELCKLKILYAKHYRERFDY